MTGKRRLQLLPEVLPKPERGPSEPGEASPVRARALARLSVLAALAATASGCGNAGDGDGDGGYGVVDPLPSPAYCPTLPVVSATYLPSAPDAGAPGAEGEAGAAPPGDAGAPRRVRVELLLPDEQLGRVTRVGPNVSLLQEDNDGERLTLDLLIEDSLADIDFGATCGAGLASYRARLRLLPDVVEAFVQRVGR
jgi:hypothetical protein